MVKKIKSKDVDCFLNKYYLSRFKDKNLNLSISKKVKIIDHYIWWFSNKREFQIFEFANKRLIYFWYQKFSFNNKFFWTCGFHVESNTNLNEIIKSYSKFLRFLKKKSRIPVVGIIVKNNIFLKKLNQDLGFKKINNTQEISYKAVKKFYNIKKSSNLIFLQL